MLPVQGSNDRCYTYTVDDARTPTWSAIAATFGVNITDLVQSNRVQLAFKRHNETVPQNETLPSGATVCSQTRTCGSNGLPVGANLTCLLSVTNSKAKFRARKVVSPQQAMPPNCTLTWVRADLTSPPKTGSVQTLCNVPVTAFGGLGNGKLSGTAVAGAFCSQLASP